METNFDVLIILHAITVGPDAHGMHLYRGHEEDRPFGRIIELDWCAFDMKKLQVLENCQNFVKPSEGFMLSPDQTVETGVNQENISNAPSLVSVMKKLIDGSFYNYTSKGKTFCLVTFGDALLTRILPMEIRDVSIKLSHSFYQYFDLLYEFKRCYPQSSHVQSVSDMLHYLKLTETASPYPSQAEVKGMLRILNKMVRDNHHFVAPRLLNTRHEHINKARETAASRKQTYKRWSGYIRGRSPEPFKPAAREWVIRVRGLPFEWREPEVTQFFKGIRIAEKNMAFWYDPDGKYSGEVFIRLMNQMDFREALSWHSNEFHNKPLEVYEGTIEEWSKALESKFPEKRENLYSVAEELSSIPSRVGIVHVHGLLPSTTDKEISGFFGPSFVEKIARFGIKRALVAGKLSEDAAIVLVDEAAANQALEYNSQKIAGAELTIVRRDKPWLEDFLKRHFIHRPFSMSFNLPPIPVERRKATLVMSGLPIDFSRDEVLSVFKGLNVVESEINFHCHPNSANVFSGTVLIPFEDEVEAQKALRTRNLTYLRNKYIELFEYR